MCVIESACFSNLHKITTLRVLGSMSSLFRPVVSHLTQIFAYYCRVFLLAPPVSSRWVKKPGLWWNPTFGFICVSGVTQTASGCFISLSHTTQISNFPSLTSGKLLQLHMQLQLLLRPPCSAPTSKPALHKPSQSKRAGVGSSVEREESQNARIWEVL